MIELIFFLLGLQVFQTYLVLLPLVIILIYNFIKIKNFKIISLELIFLIIFSLLYSIIGFYYGTVKIYYFGLIILLYLIGVLISFKKNSFDYFFRILIFFLLGIGIHAILNYSINYSLGIFNRDIIEFWSKKPWSATGQAVLLNPYFTLIPYFLLIEKNKFIKSVFLIITLLLIGYVFYLGTRSSILIIIFSFFLFLFLNYSYKKVLRLKSILFTLLFFIILLILFNYNSFDIRGFIENSVLFSRFTSSSTNLSDQYRFHLVLESLSSLIAYPFGNVQSYSFAHNLWLDVSRLTGLFPFIFLVLYSISTLINSIKYYKLKTELYQNRMLVILLISGSFIIFFFEPILETALTFFLFIVFVNGFVQSSTYKHLNRQLGGQIL